MISRCPSCGAPAPDEARECRACGWDFVANKKAEKKADAPAKPASVPDKPKASPHPAGGLALPPARGGSNDAPAAGLGMAQLPKVQGAPAPAAGAPEENPFSLPVARNLGPKPGESLFAAPPVAADPKLPAAKPKEAAPAKPAAAEPAPAEPAAKEPPKREEPDFTPAPKPAPKRKPEPAPEPEEEADDELSPALFLPSSEKEIVVEAPQAKAPARAEPKEPEPDSIFSKAAPAEPPRRHEPAASKPETERAPKAEGRRSAVYLAALAGAALGLFSIGAIFVMLRADPQGAAAPARTSPFGKRASGDATMTPVLDDPAAPPPSPASPPPLISSDEPPPTSLPAPAVPRPAAPPAPAAAPAAAADAPHRAPVALEPAKPAPAPAPARPTATFPRTERPKPAPTHAAKPPAAPKKAQGPLWVFEGTVYDLLSTRGVYGVRLLFIDAEDNEVLSVDSGEGGYYRAAMRPGPPEGYSLRIIHDDYSGKHIDELDSTSSVRKADLEQRKFLMQAGARSLPWIGTVGKPVRRDMALVPKVAAE